MCETEEEEVYAQTPNTLSTFATDIMNHRGLSAMRFPYTRQSIGSLGIDIAPGPLP